MSLMPPILNFALYLVSIAVRHSSWASPTASPITRLIAPLICFADPASRSFSTVSVPLGLEL
jgi:hypothetical protein